MVFQSGYCTDPECINSGHSVCCPRTPVWAQRKDVSDLWPVPSLKIARHNRIQVVTHNGRRIEFERIVWTDGKTVVSAFDLTFDNFIHHWMNF